VWVATPGVKCRDLVVGEAVGHFVVGDPWMRWQGAAWGVNERPVGANTVGVNRYQDFGPIAWPIDVDGAGAP
jgi:hypothetical protein